MADFTGEQGGESAEKQNIAHVANEANARLTQEVQTSGKVIAKSQDTASLTDATFHTDSAAKGENFSDPAQYAKFARVYQTMPETGIGSKEDMKRVVDEMAALNPANAAHLKACGSHIFQA